ncbi:hypothetical protein ILUMI_25742 [Ignelater luminosus]|uniref:Essential MCU regulator, mitochondrial n=1 Tax=Ignelater luminosus TaxID=2038154 RepID=A0A8K0C546_IGNLU|nr:hypothetical protein ILUMI_25742 [Ignelater luminosus]
MSLASSLRRLLLGNQRPPLQYTVRDKIRTASGGIVAEPPKVPFGIVGVVCTVISGLLIGAAISKNIANFLEENDLFVPSDDDDDDD